MGMHLTNTSFVQEADGISWKFIIKVPDQTKLLFDGEGGICASFGAVGIIERGRTQGLLASIKFPFFDIGFSYHSPFTIKN